MSLKEAAEEFLAQERIAVVGISRSPDGTANGIYKRMRARGLTAFPVSATATEVDGQNCYKNLKEIPGGVNAAMIVTRPEAADEIVHECAEVGVTHVWMHHNALFGAAGSSVSDSAVTFCRENGIEVIPGGCPMMFGPTADFGHKCMRWMLGVTGKLPKEV